MDNAFKFDEKSGGLCSEADYPYKAKQGKTCLTNCTDVPGSIVKTFVDVPPGSAKHLLAAITLQPISVAIEADQVCSFGHTSGFCVLAASPTMSALTWYRLFCPMHTLASLCFNSTRRELSQTINAERQAILITESWVRLSIKLLHVCEELLIECSLLNLSLLPLQPLATESTKKRRSLTSWSRTRGEPSGETRVMSNLAANRRTNSACVPSW